MVNAYKYCLITYAVTKPCSKIVVLQPAMDESHNMALGMPEYQALKKKLTDVFTCLKSYNLFLAFTICLCTNIRYVFSTGTTSSAILSHGSVYLVCSSNS